MYTKIREIAIENDYHLDFINGVADHVHCLISIKPSQSISDVSKYLKGGSSRWINDGNFAETYFDWQDGFAAFSVSPGNLNNVRNYIKNQEKHHHEMTFKDELVMLKDKAEKDRLG